MKYFSTQPVNKVSGEKGEEGEGHVRRMRCEEDEG